MPSDPNLWTAQDTSDNNANKTDIEALIAALGPQAANNLLLLANAIKTRTIAMAVRH